MVDAPQLPDAPFAEIAVDLWLYARSAHEAAVAGEILLHRAGQEFTGLRQSIEDLWAAARRANQLYWFFRSAGPDEQELRDLLAGFFATRVPATIELEPLAIRRLGGGR